MHLGIRYLILMDVLCSRELRMNAKILDAFEVHFIKKTPSLKALKLFNRLSGVKIIIGSY